MKTQLPKFVHEKHGAYYYVRRNPANQKVIWTRLGKTYPEMLRALATLSESSSQITMRDLLIKYQNEVVSKQTIGTQKKRAWQIRKLIYSFGDMLPSEITTQILYQYHAKRTEKASASANSEISLLSTVFTHAIKWGILASNPAVKMIKNKQEPRDRYLTDAEFKTLIDNSTGFTKRAFELAYLTGQRIGDVLKMRWSDLNNDLLFVRQQKSGKELSIKVSAALSALLNECRSQPVVGQNIIANPKGRQVTYGMLLYHFRKACESAQLSDVRLHDIRRKAASDTPLESELLGNTRAVRERVYRVAPVVTDPVK